MSLYEPYYQKAFTKRITSKKKTEKQKVQVFKEGVEKILAGKIQGTKFLHGESLRGKRRLVLPDDLRIVFAICEECKRLGHQEFNQCNACSTISSKNSAVFFYALDRAKGYKL